MLMWHSGGVDGRSDWEHVSRGRAFRDVDRLGGEMRFMASSQ
ncbi:hypothetical protein [Rosistilla oblonga]